MGVNKVVFGAVSIMDISDSTVTPEKLAKDAVAYGADGERIIGTMEEKVDPVLQEKTVTPTTSKQTVTPDAAYDGLSKVTVNAMPTATQATPSIEVSSAGLITAKATQSAGYVAAGTKNATKQLTTQGAQTITPGTADKTIASGKYLTGTQTIKGDANLVAGNIKSGVSIFGVAGTLETGSGGGSSGGGSVETCTIVFDSKYNDALACYPACVTVFEDGECKPKWWSNYELKDITVQNVVCGSAIVFANISNLKNYTTSGSNAGLTVSGGVTIVKIDSSKKYVIFQAPTAAGATGTIFFTVA